MKVLVSSLKNKYQFFIVIEIRVGVDISEENSTENYIRNLEYGTVSLACLLSY